MNNVHFAILVTIYKIIDRGRKHYGRPAVDTLIGLIDKYHGRKIGRRWAFQCLRDLEEGGYITRRKRFARDGEGNWVEKPSLIIITLTGAKYLVSKGISGAQSIVRQILEFLTKKYKVWPSAAEAAPVRTDESIALGLSEVRKILNSLG